MSAPAIVTCACGRSYNYSAWAQLDDGGMQIIGDGGADLALKHCVCRSTFGIDERWRPIPEWPGYDASDLGRIRTWRCPGHRDSRLQVPKLRKPFKMWAGYWLVHLNGKQARNVQVHRLVLSAFAGPRPSTLHAAHLNGDRSDNRLVNLAWLTALENEAQKKRDGTWSHGTSHGQAKLTEQAVIEIIKRLAIGDEVEAKIASQFGVNVSTVSLIRRGKTWKHVQRPQGFQYSGKYEPRLRDNSATVARNKRGSTISIDVECRHDAPACECAIGLYGPQTCPVHAPEWDERSER